jgi:maleate isomerase
MYGWRGRIGVVLPCINTAIEPEFNHLAQFVPGLGIHAARVHLEVSVGGGLTPESAMDSVKTLDTAVIEVSHANVGVILYGCTSGSFSGGPGWDKVIINRIQDKTGIPATTSTTALVQALRSLEIRKVALGTPYDDRLTEIEKTFLESEGFEVVRAIGLNNIEEINNVPSNLAYQLARQVDHPEAEAICIACTDFPTMDVLEVMEQDRGKPVISVNIASFWYSLKILGIKAAISGHGRLIA